MNELERNAARNELVELNEGIEICSGAKSHGEQCKNKEGSAKGSKKIISPLEQRRTKLICQYFHRLRTSAAYHRAKLNGVDCQELICLAKQIFSRFENICTPLLMM